jgi:hypothetical protein
LRSRPGVDVIDHSTDSRRVAPSRSRTVSIHVWRPGLLRTAHCRSLAREAAGEPRGNHRLAEPPKITHDDMVAAEWRHQSDFRTIGPLDTTARAAPVPASNL